MAQAGLAPLIAVVGCDGSGKSTLSADLLAWLRQSREVDTVYLGLRSGVMGNRIKSWPLIGRAFERQLSKKAGQARNKDGKIPGAATAFVIYMFSVKRMRAFRRMLALRKRGVTIVTDRYPQVEVPGFYDGPGLSAARAEGWLVSRLARRERAMYETMISHVPDLVIRLNVDVDTAFARKPDHKRASLEAKVAVTPYLKFNGAKIVDLCSTDPYPTVLEQAKAAVTDALSTPRSG
ncbi:MAG TPA: nucleoside triphosphate hydrolase [Sphingobium sp.]